MKILFKSIVSCFGVMVLLTSCTEGQSADLVYTVCLDKQGVTKEILDIFDRTSKEYGFDYYNGGELAAMNSRRLADSTGNPTKEPVGVPTFFSIKNKSGKVLIVGDNLAGFQSLQISFFTATAKVEIQNLILIL